MPAEAKNPIWLSVRDLALASDDRMRGITLKKSDPVPMITQAIKMVGHPLIRARWAEPGCGGDGPVEGAAASASETTGFPFSAP
jgi:hypothetical protein